MKRVILVLVIALLMLSCTLSFMIVRARKIHKQKISSYEKIIDSVRTMPMSDKWAVIGSDFEHEAKKLESK